MITDHLFLPQIQIYGPVGVLFSRPVIKADGSPVAPNTERLIRTVPCAVMKLLHMAVNECLLTTFDYKQVSHSLSPTKVAIIFGVLKANGERHRNESFQCTSKSIPGYGSRAHLALCVLLIAQPAPSSVITTKVYPSCFVANDNPLLLSAA